MSYKEFKEQKISGNRTLRGEYLRLSRRRSLMYFIAKQIKEQRIKLGLTQEGLARRVGTHQSGIARLENGSSLPSLSFLIAVAEALECELKFHLTHYQNVKDEIHAVKPVKYLNERSVQLTLVQQQPNKADTREYSKNK